MAVQAMTSGAIAGFLDVAFNFNTQALLDDNLIGKSSTSYSIPQRLRSLDEASADDSLHISKDFVACSCSVVIAYLRGGLLCTMD